MTYTIQMSIRLRQHQVKVLRSLDKRQYRRKAFAIEVNVRRLLINLKKFVANSSRNLVFEQNTSELRNPFLNIVNPYMEQVQANQGLNAFRVVMDDSNNTQRRLMRIS